MSNSSWNTASGEWATTGDWSPAGAPSNTSDATVSNGGTVTVGSSDFGAVAETLSVSNGAVVVNGELQVDGLSVTGSGSITVDGGSLITGAQGQGGTTFSQIGNITLVNDGSLETENSIHGAVSGTVTLDGVGSNYIFDNSLASSTSSAVVDFTTSGGFFTDQQQWNGTINGFNTADSNIIGFAGSVTSHSYNSSTKVLSVTAGGKNYTLKFADNQQPLTSANFTVDPSGFAIDYTGAIFQQISSSTYDAASGALHVSGFNFSTSTGAYDVTALTINGEDGVGYTLTSGSTIAAGPTLTSFTVDLSAADQLAVDGLLNANGATSALGVTYGLSAAASFETGGTASFNTPITASNALVPTLSSVVYDFGTGIFTLTGANMDNEGTTYGVNPFNFTITGQGGATYTLTLDDAFATSFTSASFQLTGTDLSSVNALLDKVGTSSLDNTTYNLAATAGWDSEVGAAITTETISVVCFASGTRIRTSRGDVAVEALQVGDLVVTASGERRPIRWLGHRRIDCRRHPRPSEVMPVRIAAGAFGPNRPARDLYVSPAHAIGVDVVGEVLVPAIALVNGATIQQLEVDEIAYWHVELDSHDLLVAENLPAESYLEAGNRGFFADGGVVQLSAGPDAVDRAQLEFCRPFHEAGLLVDVVRSQLLVRARALGWTLHCDALADLHLLVDGVRIDPYTDDRRARFHLPAGAREVWLASATTRPVDVGGGADARPLGVCVTALFVDGGSQPELRLDDPALDAGFHEVERDGDRLWRWTSGRARLPDALWRGDGPFALTVELGGDAPPRWVAASEETVVAKAA